MKLFAVTLNEIIIGAIENDGERSEFYFAEPYLTMPGRPILGLHFEDDLSRRYVSSVRLPPWFSNLLPEGTLRGWIAEDRAVSAAREMELLAHVGHDLPGAIQVIPTNAIEFERAQHRSELEFEAPPAMTPEAPWRFSLAGVALKMSMLRQGTTFTIPSRGTVGDTIIKFPDRTFKHVPLNEWAMMRLAGRTEIEVPQVHLIHREEIDAPDNLWPGGEVYAYAVDRFDRTVDGGRIHIEDFAQVRGFYAARKYQATMETLGALIFHGQDEESLKQYVRRQIFNILVSNGDAHLKNWSLLYSDPRRPRLAPAYDLVSTAFYRPGGRPEALGMKLAGSRKFERCRLHHFRDLGRLVGYRGAPLDEIANDQISLVLEHLDGVATDLAPAQDMQAMILSSCRARAQTLRSSLSE